ncbi:hypothetical protein AAW51_2096 [Caldimonas brevitalea]|uniref:Uncharacterized protein n=1 Tax=Caldimonas brevitalea TaxID=413882 RepID=A0A0G3BHH6_9BURK|nr:hypothetical protein AAW51_2096 [Caldimonas brevitalea]
MRDPLDALNPEEDLFWATVRSMPWVEAEEVLRARRGDTLRRMNAAQRAGNGVELSCLARLTARLNDEIHLVSQRAQRARWSAAVRAVYGDEGWAQVIQWMRAEEATG